MAPRIAQPHQYLLTRPQMANELAISDEHLKNLTNDGLVPFIKLGKSVRYERDAVRAAIAKLTVNAQ
jgi:excisionase family DNA binding protein